MATTKVIHYEQEIPDVIAALAAVHNVMDEYDVDRNIVHLVRLRASQINRCAFCVKMHTKEARDDGETNERLDRLVVWQHVNDFSDREKAALAWTEALTQLDSHRNFAELREQLKAHYSDQQISILTASVAMINLWNRIQGSKY